MFSRFRISFTLAIFLSVVIAIPAFAGGWAVITLDELPSGVVAGEPLTIGFTVRQHGRTLMTGLYPKVTAVSGGEKLVFPAEAEGGPGHYTATLTLPNEGEWKWAIEAFTMYQPMPALKVAAAGTAASLPVKEIPQASLFSAYMIPVSLVVLALGLLVAFIGVRRKSRWITLTALVLLGGFALLAVSTGATSRMSAQAKSEFSSDPAVSQVELGKQLFLAKGCITCHANSRASGSIDYITIEVGAPNLSSYSSSPEILFIRLKDPAAAKSDSKMPNLELKKTEIEALIAFINSK